MPCPEDPILQALDRYRAAVLAKNVDAFSDLYDEDVEVFDMWGSWRMKGKARWRAMAAEWFSSLGDERVLVGIKDVQSMCSGELATGHATITYTAVSAAGGELRSLSNRITVVMKRGAAGWKIVHEHTSAPIEHGSLTAILHEPDAA